MASLGDWHQMANWGNQMMQDVLRLLKGIRYSPLWEPWVIEVAIVSPPPGRHLIMKLGFHDKCIFRVPRLIGRFDWQLKRMLTGCRHRSLSRFSALHPLSYKHAKQPHVWAECVLRCESLAAAKLIFFWSGIGGKRPTASQFTNGSFWADLFLAEFGVPASRLCVVGVSRRRISQRNTWSFLSCCSWSSHACSFAYIFYISFHHVAPSKMMFQARQCVLPGVHCPHKGIQELLLFVFFVCLFPGILVTRY